MRFVSYAQNFEDVLLWRALSHVNVGFYIDIGAQSPLVDSVSQGFYEQGWRGCHVEPTQRYAAELRQQRPDETVLQVALGAMDGDVELFEIADTGLSTTLTSIAEKHANNGKHSVRRIVKQQTLDALFSQLNQTTIHWMKIDVEGAEASVLNGWRQSSARPWILVIEATQPGTTISTLHEWEHLVLAKGYVRVYFDGLNSFFVSNEHLELASAFALPVNVFDDFEFSGLSSSSFCQRLASQLADSRKQYQILEARRLALENTVSWRVTAPFRQFQQAVRSSLDAFSASASTVWNSAETAVRQLLLWSIRVVLRRPLLATVARKCLVMIPSLESRLVSVAVRGGVVPAMGVPQSAAAVHADLSDESLTGWGRRIHRRLQAHHSVEQERCAP